MPTEILVMERSLRCSVRVVKGRQSNRSLRRCLHCSLIEIYCNRKLASLTSHEIREIFLPRLFSSWRVEVSKGFRGLPCNFVEILSAFRRIVWIETGLHGTWSWTWVHIFEDLEWSWTWWLKLNFDIVLLWWLTVSYWLDSQQLTSTLLMAVRYVLCHLLANLCDSRRIYDRSVSEYVGFNVPLDT